MTIITLNRNDLASLCAIAPLVPEDFAAARELHRAAMKTDGWRSFSLQEVEAKLEEIDGADYSLRLLSENALAAKLKQTLVGTAFWCPSTVEKETAVITEVYTHPLFTGGGIATRMVQSLEEAAVAEGFKRVVVKSNLNSRSFFTKLGYVSEGFEIYKTSATIAFPLRSASNSI